MISLWKYFKTCLFTTVLAESCNKLKVPWIWFIAVWIISVIKLDYISTWFNTIHMYTECVQSQGCAHPNTFFGEAQPFFVLKNKNLMINILIFFVFNILFIILIVIIFFFSYTLWMFHFILLMDLNISYFFPRKHCCEHVHKYSSYIILPVWSVAFHIPIHDKLTSTQNLIHPPNWWLETLSGTEAGQC